MPRCAKRVRPGAGERDLADRGGGLAVLELQRALGQAGNVRPSAIAPEDTTSTLAPRPCRAAMSSTSASSHACFDGAGGAVDQQRRADLDDDPVEPVERRKLHHDRRGEEEI